MHLLRNEGGKDNGKSKRRVKKRRGGRNSLLLYIRKEYDMGVNSR